MCRKTPVFICTISRTSGDFSKMEAQSVLHYYTEPTLTVLSSVIFDLWSFRNHGGETETSLKRRTTTVELPKCIKDRGD